MATINKDGLVESIQLHDIFTDVSKTRSKQFIEDFFGQIVTAVAAGDTVSIAGFGKFEPFTLANGSVVPKFRPFKDFKDSVAA